MIIAQLTDTHILELKNATPDRAQRRINDLRICIKDINKIIPRPDLVMHTGDITQTAKIGEYKLVKKLLNSLKVPVFVIPGNRDSRKLVRETFPTESDFCQQNDEPIMFEINSFKVRLIGIDSLSKIDGRGDFGLTRIQKLEEMLQARPKTPTAIFMHHPPITLKTPTTTFLEFITKKKSDEFLSLLSRHSQIIRVFCGHAHRPYREFFNKIEISTAPSVASDLRKGCYPLKLQNKPIYQLHAFDGSGSFISQTRLPLSA